jgi:hypothetical protein
MGYNIHHGLVARSIYESEMIMDAKALILELRSKANRQNAALILNGLGVNFWHYQGFLRHFTVEELKDFAAIYAISGAGGGFWFHLLSQEDGLKTEQIKNLDPLLRSTLNALPAAPDPSHLLDLIASIKLEKSGRSAGAIRSGLGGSN